MRGSGASGYGGVARRRDAACPGVVGRPRSPRGPHCQPEGGSRNGVPDSDRKERPQRMNSAAFFALARRDLRLFFMDRRAMIMSFVAPILIGSFFGYLFGGVSDREPSKIEVSVVNQ